MYSMKRTTSPVAPETARHLDDCVVVGSPYHDHVDLHRCEASLARGVVDSLQHSRNRELGIIHSLKELFVESIET